jgi:hypothetical protein
MSLTTAARAASLAFLAVLLMSAGCSQGLSRTDPVQPASPQDKACLQRCELPRTQCRQRQEAREKECGEIYALARAEYDSCVKSGTARCKAPYTCLGADLSICDQEYDDCFAACRDQMARRTPAAATEKSAAKAGAGTGGAAPAESGDRPGADSATGSTPARMDPP